MTHPDILKIEQTGYLTDEPKYDYTCIECLEGFCKEDGNYFDEYEAYVCHDCRNDFVNKKYAIR